jgi:NADH-quinone oxidoreductase subunit J
MELLLLFSALLVITSRQMVHSILALMLVFCETTALLFSWEMDYLGLLLLIVYVGAIAILFLFVVMMLNLKGLAENQWKYWPLGGLIATLFFSELVLLSEELSPIHSYFIWSSPSSSQVQVLSSLLYQEYGVLILLAGYLLFLTLVGVLHLTKRGCSS